MNTPPPPPPPLLTDSASHHSFSMNSYTSTLATFVKLHEGYAIHEEAEKEKSGLEDLMSASTNETLSSIRINGEVIQEGPQKYCTHCSNKLQEENNSPPTMDFTSRPTTNSDLDALTASMGRLGLNKSPVKLNPNKIYVRQFFQDLTRLLNIAMSEPRLGPEALIFWKESEYQSILAGIVTTLVETTYKDCISFYRFEQWVSETHTLEDIEGGKSIAATSTMGSSSSSGGGGGGLITPPYSPTKFNNRSPGGGKDAATTTTVDTSNNNKRKRVDLMIRFKHHPLVVVEIKYVPLQYVRFPKSVDSFSEIQKLAFDSTELQSKYSVSLSYSRTLEAERTALMRSSNGSNYLTANKKFVQEENRYLTFEVAPGLDKKYKEACRMITDYSYCSESNLLLELYHNAERFKMVKLVENAKRQCLDYGKIINKANIDSHPEPVECHVLWGLWRTTSHVICEDIAILSQTSTTNQ